MATTTRVRLADFLLNPDLDESRLELIDGEAARWFEHFRRAKTQLTAVGGPSHQPALNPVSAACEKATTVRSETGGIGM